MVILFLVLAISKNIYSGCVLYNIMSSPDDLTKLKTTVELYEKELRETVEFLKIISEGIDPKKVDIKVLGGFGLEAFFRMVDLNNKLLNAYREYVQALEKIVPR
ncbi:MAG: hypothetical protein H3Z51_12320 [archaeon]|nr:hypothetical protein [archaeon]